MVTGSCSFEVKVLSTGAVHTLLMSCPVMVSLRCRAVGDTPIYDQLQGERINAHVPPSTPESRHLPRSADHRRSAVASRAAAVEVQAAGPGLADALVPATAPRADDGR